MWRIYEGFDAALPKDNLIISDSHFFSEVGNAPPTTGGLLIHGKLSVSLFLQKHFTIQSF